MNSKAVAIIAIVLLLAGGTAAAGGGTVAAEDASASESSTEITGISVGPVTDDVEYGANITEIKQVLESLGYSAPEEATWVTTPDDTKHLVFSDEPIPAGKATVSGQQLSVPGIDPSIVFADDFEVQRTGEHVTFSEFESNTSAYAYEVVELESKVRVGAVAAKPADSSAVKLSVATFDPPGSTVGPSIDTAPGQYARQAAINLSEHDLESLAEVDAVLGIGEFKGAAFDHQFWGSGDANATVAVIPKYDDPAFQEPELVGYDLVLVDVDYDSTRLEGPGELADNAGEYDGEMVSLESDVVGRTTSPQEFLTSTASCGGKTIWVPGTSVCVPLVADTVVHSGVAVSVDGDVEMIPYAALSNEIQQTIAESETGRYELTGEVVDASEIAPGVDGAAGLIVHDMERVGDATLDEGIESQAQAQAEEIEDSIRTQINTSRDEWNDADHGSDGPGNDSGDGDETGTGDENGSEDETGNESDDGETGDGDDGEADDGETDDGTGDENESGDQGDGDDGTGDEDDGETGDENGSEAGDGGETGDEGGETGDEDGPAGVIRPDACLEDGELIADEGFVVEDGSIEDANLTVGANTSVTLSVVSCHQETATVSVSLRQNGAATDASTVVELAPGESRTVTVPYEPTSEGTYELAANGTATAESRTIGTVDVGESPPGDSDGTEDEPDESSSESEESSNDGTDGSSANEGSTDEDSTNENVSSDGDGESTESRNESDGGNESASDGGADSGADDEGSSDDTDPSIAAEEEIPGFGVVAWMVAAVALASLVAARRSRSTQ